MRDPLVVWEHEGKLILLDGHNRRRILECIRVREGTRARDHGQPMDHSLTLEVEIINLPDREAAKNWIEEYQAGRRNLTDDQKAMMWAAILERRAKTSRAEAAAKAREGKADPSSVAAKRAATERKPREQEKAAKQAGLSVKKVRTAIKLRKTNPEAAEDVRRGKKTLRQAKRETKPKPEQFLPEVRQGTVVLVEHHDPLHAGRKSHEMVEVSKRTDCYIYVGKTRYKGTMDGKGRGVKLLNSFSRILRPATEEDRQDIAKANAEREAEEQEREAEEQKCQAMFREFHLLVKQIPTEHEAGVFLESNGTCAEFTVRFNALVTLDQLKRIVETLQVAPALAE